MTEVSSRSTVSSAMTWTRGVLRDARVFQVTFQACLLLTGLLVRKFSITGAQIFLTFAAALATQALFVRLLRLKDAGYRSAWITGMGLCLFLRSANLWIHPLAAFVSIASKFVIRVRGKHVFNPSNFGAVLSLLLFASSGKCWLTTGQWGYGILMAFWCVMLGAVVVKRARRTDVSWMFLAVYLGAVAARVLSHGQNWAVFWYQINGGLLIFTFFMISDPMTIPDSRRGRLLFAALVALLAYALQFEFYRFNAWIWSWGNLQTMTSSTMGRLFFVNGMLVALTIVAPLAPLIDRVWPAPRYRWEAPAAAAA